MSRQLTVINFFKKPNNDVDKRGEKRGTDAIEDEGQTQPSASAERASGSKEVRREYRVQWEQEFPCKYVGIIIDETTNITVEKMLITYLTLQQKGEPETVFIGNHTVPSGTAECITGKIKDVLSGRGVAMARVVGLGSDGANVMVGRKAGVAQQLRQNDCPFLVNIHCGVHRTALAARDASTAVRKVSAYVTTVNNIYTHYKNSPTRTHRLHELQKEMGEHDLLIKGMRANWAAVVSELREEEEEKNCPVAKGIRKRIQTYTFPALTHLLTDVLAVVNRMNLIFQKEDVNISSISPVVRMTLASLEDLMNGPGEAEKKFNEASQDGNFCGVTLAHVDAQTFSTLRTEYIAEVTKSIKKRFPSEHLNIISDLDTVLNASHYPGGAGSAFKSYGQEALERVCDHYGSQTGAADPLVQKERMLRDFLPLKRVLAGSGNPSFKESCRLLITSLGEMFPDFKTLAEEALVIPVSTVAAERGFSLQNNIKTATRSRLSETKVQNLMTIASAAIPLETFDYAQVGARFKSMRTRRKV
uniref:HAT C-terminal dimerisation domain-containing protein n=1 Tax=Myripristis murdjan TaxID=586833 RepID=A0A667XDF6_9TELE